jgi:hypothetical protein
MLTVRLDPETEQKLADIIAHERDVNRSSLVKRLILERWLTLNLDNTFVERRGGILSTYCKMHHPICPKDRPANKLFQTTSNNGTHDLSAADPDR